MDTKETKKEMKVKEAVEVFQDLDKMLTERISDLYEVKGGMQARHCYSYYRAKVWEALTILGARG